MQPTTMKVNIVITKEKADITPLINYWLAEFIKWDAEKNNKPAESNKQ